MNDGRLLEKVPDDYFEEAYTLLSGKVDANLSSRNAQACAVLLMISGLLFRKTYVWARASTVACSLSSPAFQEICGSFKACKWLRAMY